MSDEATPMTDERLALARQHSRRLVRALVLEIDRLRSLATEATGLREAATRYLPYAEHSYGCAVRNRHSPDCDCGLTALRAALSSSAPSTALETSAPTAYSPTPQEGEPA